MKFRIKRADVDSNYWVITADLVGGFKSEADAQKFLDSGGMEVLLGFERHKAKAGLPLGQDGETTQ